MSQAKNQDTKVDPLENFRVLAEGAKGEALIYVIKNAIKHPQVFVFGEILNVQSVKDLANNPQLKPYLELLRIFAYGSYPEFKAHEKDLKLKEELDPKSRNKLKMLSIVEAASKNKFLFYDKLMKDLDVQSVRDLEDLVIDCVYANLLQGKLDQRKKAFEVQWVMGRDLGPTEVEDMLKTVDVWLKNSEQLMTALDEKMKAANTAHEKRKADALLVSKTKTDTVENLKALIAAGDPEAIAMAMGMPTPAGRGGPGDQKGGGKRGGKGGPAVGIAGIGADMLKRFGVGGGRRG